MHIKRPAVFKVHEDFKWLEVEEPAQDAFSKSDFIFGRGHSNGYDPTRIAGWRMTAYLITVAVSGIVIILIAENYV